MREIAKVKINENIIIKMSQMKLNANNCGTENVIMENYLHENKN